MTTGLILVIIFATAFAIFYVHFRLSQIQQALPVEITVQKNALVSLLDDMADLVQSLKIEKYIPSHRQVVEQEILKVRNNLNSVRNTYKFDNLLGAAAFHAVLSPALSDIERWFKNGVHALDPRSNQVKDLIELRALNAYSDSRRLYGIADQSSIDILTMQSRNIEKFSKVITYFMGLLVLLSLFLVYLIARHHKYAMSLQQSDERSRDFAALTSDYIWEADDQLRFTFASEGYNSILKMSDETVIGKSIREIWTKTLLDSEMLESCLVHLENHLPVDGYILEGPTRSEGSVYLQLHGRPLFGESGEFEGYRGGIKDVSEIISARRLAERSRLKAENASLAKSRFLANVSHEIRSPMTVIVGMIDLLKESTLTSQQQQRLTAIQQSSASLLQLINGILDVSRIESDQEVVEQKNFKLKNALRQMLQTYEDLISDKDIVLSLEVSNKLPEYFVSDRFRIEQVLRNLIDNALKFTEKGEVKVAVSAVETMGRHLVLQFTVSDTGIGLPEEFKQSIFEPFKQIDPTSTRRFGGAGLGLSICKQIVSLLGGRIWVESIVGEGSDFHFTVVEGELDIEQESDGESVITQSPVHISTREYDFHRYGKILIVEDDEIISLLLQEFLKETGHEIEIAMNGLEGLECYKRKDFDLILMDLLMPEMDGYRAATEIRKFESSQGKNPVPIIALSASVLESEIENSKSAGFSAHVSKPLHKSAVIQVVQQHFRCGSNH